MLPVMPVVELSAAQIARLIDVAGMIPIMRDALLADAQRRIEIPPRVHWPLGGGALNILVMPARSDELKLAVFKFLTLVDGNRDVGLPAIMGDLLVIDAVTGMPRARLAAEAVTLLRTAACSAAATDLLAPAGAGRLAVFGSGPQAMAHVAAMFAVRPVASILVQARDNERLERFAQELRLRFDVPVTCGPDADMLARAEIVCTITNAKSPLFQMGDIHPRAHINAVGSYRPDMCELPGDLVRRAAVFADSCEACARGAGDLIDAYGSSAAAMAHIRAIGELIAQPLTMRPGGRTIYKSVGNAGQDLYAAAAILVRAR